MKKMFLDFSLPVHVNTYTIIIMEILTFRFFQIYSRESSKINNCEWRMMTAGTERTGSRQYWRTGAGKAFDRRLPNSGQLTGAGVFDLAKPSVRFGIVGWNNHHNPLSAVLRAWNVFILLSLTRGNTFFFFWKRGKL